MTDTADNSFREVFKEAVWVGFRQTILDQGSELGVLLRLLLDEAKRVSGPPEFPRRGEPMPPSHYMQRRESTVLTSTIDHCVNNVLR